MQRITPHLWFDKEAKDAAAFYTANFPDSRIIDSTTIHEVPTPTGDCDVVSFELCGQPFMAINAGPLFTFNPSISFFIRFDPSADPRAREKLDTLWEVLSRDGMALMPLDKYPFSDRFGWIQDKYGVSWQLILAGPETEPRAAIVPSLLFVGAVAGRAEEAVNFYVSVFRNSKLGALARYGKGQEPNREGTVMFADFSLDGQWFAAMDSAWEHKFAFNEALSLVIPCETQEEIDYFWEKLSSDPNAEQCGWLKDRFGVSWQAWPVALGEMLAQGTPEQKARVTRSFLAMKKYDLAALKRAFAGESPTPQST